MIKSMTGYGKAEFEYGNKKFTLEIKTLNSKQLDINTRIPALYREKDLAIRKELSEKLIRGKVDFNIYTENLGEESSSKINEAIVKSYFNHLSEISESLKLPVNVTTLEMALRLPDTIKTEYEELDETEWNVILENIRKALLDIDHFRMQEGEALKTDLINNINSIKQLLGEIQPFEKQRIENIRARITENLESFKLNGNVDENRFEQELIFYLEKLDINEEKVRLLNHIVFFSEVLEYPESAGKKLGFISQELGREINTIGSKANDSNIQRIVVEMKDSLERIKEQVLNVL
ncbi:MAG: YicC family protein [Prolixibacteraceae bacterium]|nr:YicC family protein [Prolixibacteraceae bacterium]MBN2775296.1 YicC family protein [Prolixibacteraceae bacterium]